LNISIPSFIKGKTSRQKNNKEAENLNNTIDQVDITDISRISYPTAEENTSFSGTHRIFCR
jgi:hypothetical protein